MYLLHRLFPRLHRWEVEWNDDDVCTRCPALRYWPNGTVIHRANAYHRH